VHLNRQAVDVDGQVAQAPATALSAQPPGGEFGQRLAQHGPVGLKRQDIEQAGERRLRGEVCAFRQRRGAARPGNGAAQGGIEAQRIGVVLIAPALGEQHQHGAQQLGQRIGDEMRLPRVVQSRGHPFEDAGALDHLAHEDRAGVAGQMFGAGFDGQAGVEAGGDWQQRFTHGVARLVVASWFSSLILLRDSRHASHP